MRQASRTRFGPAVHRAAFPFFAADLKRMHPCPPPTDDITVPITDHPAGAAMKGEAGDCPIKKIRTRLALDQSAEPFGLNSARMRVSVVKCLERNASGLQLSQQPSMDCRYLRHGAFSKRCIWLVRNKKQAISARREPRQRRKHAIAQMKVLRPNRRFPGAGTRVVPVVIDDPIAVEKDRATRQRTASHFISFCLRSGWLTIRCQITAWNASVCGVTVSALIVGITTTASATCFV